MAPPPPREPLPPWLTTPAGKDVLLRERKEAAGEPIARSKDVGPFGKLQCITTIVEAETQRTISTGSLQTMGKTNCSLSVSIHTQRPLLSLQFKSKTTSETDEVVTFDPDYVERLEVVELCQSQHENSPFWDEYRRAAASSINWKAGPDGSFVRDSSDANLPSLDRIIRLSIKLATSDHARRVWSMHLQPVPNRCLSGPVNGFVQSLVHKASAVVVHIRVPDGNYAYVRENIRHFQHLLSLRETMVPEGRNAQSNFMAAREYHWDEASRGAAAYHIFRERGSAPSKQPWLQLPNKQSAYAFAFSENEITNKAALFNPRMFAGTMIQAVLWEREHQSEAIASFFGGTRLYKVKTETVRANSTLLFFLQLDELRKGEKPLAPPDGHHADLRLVDIPDNQGNATRCTGRLYTNPDKDWPLVFVCRASLGEVGVNGITRGTLSMSRDLPYETAKLLAMELFIDNDAHIPSTREGLVGFSLAKTQLGRIEADRRSPDFIQEFGQGHNHNIAYRDAIFEEVESILLSLDDDQKAVAKKILRSAEGALAIFDGFAGCGKTSTEAKIWLCVTLLGFRVLVISHSNAAVDVALKMYVDLVSASSNKQGDSSRIVRLYSRGVESTLEMRAEAALAQECGSEQEIAWERVECMDGNIKQDTASLSMAWAIDRYIREHASDDSNTIEYLKHRAAAARHICNPTTSKSHSMESTREYLSRQVLKGVDMVATTASLAPQIAELEYKPDLIFIDEASTMNCADAIHALRSFGTVAIVGLAGDQRQLNPICASAQAQTNPYGNYLQRSVMDMWPSINPQLEVVSCHYNYRQVMELFNLSNTCWYDGKMLMGAGADERANTPFSQAMRAALGDRSLFGGLLDRAAHQNRRLIVLNVDSPDEQSLTMSRFNNAALSIAAKLFAHLSNKDVFQAGSGMYVTPYQADRDMWAAHLYKVGLSPSVIPGLTANLSQGSQADLVVASFVRGKVDENPFGFLNDAKRLNVMTSRARQYSFYICNLRAWNESQRRSPTISKTHAHMWKLKTYLEQHAVIVSIPLSYAS